MICVPGRELAWPGVRSCIVFISASPAHVAVGRVCVGIPSGRSLILVVLDMDLLLMHELGLRLALMEVDQHSVAGDPVHVWVPVEHVWLLLLVVREALEVLVA